MADEPARGWSGEHHGLAQAQGFPDWSAWCEAVEEEVGYKVCGARAGRSDEDSPGYHWRPCRRQAGWGLDRDWGRCRNHETPGAFPAGPDNPRWKDGSHSAAKYRVRDTLARRYEELSEELDDAFDLVEEAVMLNARMRLVLEGLPEAPITPEVVRGVVTELDTAVGGLRDQVREVLRGGDPRRLMTALRRLESALSEAQEGALTDAEVEWRAWEEWQRLVNQKRLLARTHSLAEMRKHGPVSWTDVLVIVDHVKTIIVDHTEPDQQDTILREFRTLMESPGTPSLN